MMDYGRQRPLLTKYPNLAYLAFIVEKTRGRCPCYFQACCANFLSHASAVFLHFAVRIDIYDDWIDTLSAQKVVQHALKWYFTLFWGKFRIITSVLFLCVKFLSLLLFTLPTTMPASHLFGGKDTPCPINRTDVSYMLLHDGNPNVNRLLDFTQHLEGSGIDKMVLVEFECLSYLT